MQRNTRQILAAAAGGVFLASAGAMAQTVGYSGGNYSQNFNTLPNSGGPIPLQNVLTPQAISAVAPTGMDGWYVQKTTGTNAPTAVITSGSIPTPAAQAPIGIFASMGADGSVDRALGSSSTTQMIARFGVVLMNNSTDTFKTLDLQYIVEQWNVNKNAATAGDTLNTFEYVVGGAGIDAAGGTAVPSGAWNSTVSQTAGGFQNLDGNNVANQAFKQFQITGLNWLPGQTLVLRWNDVNDANGDDYLAIDDFNFSATAARQVKWGGVSGVWDYDTNNLKWRDKNNLATFAQPDDVSTFGDIVADNIVDIAGAVTPASTAITHSANTYTFNGSIATGSITKTGAGNVIFNSANPTTSAVSLSGGTVTSNADQTLGTGPLVLNNVQLNVRQTLQQIFGAVTATGNVVIETDQFLSMATALRASTNGALTLRVLPGGGLNLPATLTGGSSGTSITFDNQSGSAVTTPVFSGFGGNVIVKSGTVISSNNGTDLFTESTILQVDAGATFDMAGNGETMGTISGAGTINVGTVPTAAESFLIFNGPFTTTFSGVINGSGGGAFTVSNALTNLTLSGQSTFANPTVLLRGVTTVGADVLPLQNGPFGNTDSAIRLGGDPGTTSPATLLIAGNHQIGRAIFIPTGTTATAFATMGGADNASPVFSAPIP